MTRAIPLAVSRHYYYTMLYRVAALESVSVVVCVTLTVLSPVEKVEEDWSVVARNNNGNENEYLISGRCLWIVADFADRSRVIYAYDDTRVGWRVPRGVQVISHISLLAWMGRWGGLDENRL